MTLISIRLPADFIEDLKDAAQWTESGSYQELIRRYVSQGLSRDLRYMDDERAKRDARTLETS